MVMMTWLADVLRAAGLAVIECDGWQTRGRGEMGQLEGVMIHHTGTPKRNAKAPTLDLILSGRPDLAGPLSQLLLDRDGTFYVVAAGRCNHAGVGEWQGLRTGNTNFIGIECENAGTNLDPWPREQMHALTIGVAAILLHGKLDDVRAVGHREYALPRGRKIDPLFDMVEFRSDVADAMATAARPAALPAPVNADRVMLRKGDSGRSVLMLQTHLNSFDIPGVATLKMDSAFGPATDRAVRVFQRQSGLEAEGLVGPKTWKALLRE